MVGYYDNPDNYLGLGGGFVRETSGTITRIDVPGSLTTNSFSINDHDQIVGVYYDMSGTPHGFLFGKGRYTALDAPGQQYTLAQGINDQATSSSLSRALATSR